MVLEQNQAEKQKKESQELKIILNGKLLNGLFIIDRNFCQLTKNN